MATFFVFMKLTEDGARRIGTIQEDLAKALTAANHDLQAEVQATTYALFGGPYDFVDVCMADEFEDVAYYSLQLNETGAVQTTTPRAYDWEQYMVICQRLGKMAP